MIPIMWTDIIKNCASIIAVIAATIGSAKYIIYLLNKNDLNVIFATASQNDFDRFIGTILAAVSLNSVWNLIMFMIVKNDILTIIYGIIFGVSLIILGILFLCTIWHRSLKLSFWIYILGNAFLISYAGLEYGSLVKQSSILGMFIVGCIFSIIITYGFFKTADFYKKIKSKKYRTLYFRDKRDVDNLLNSLDFSRAIDPDHLLYVNLIDNKNAMYFGPHYIYYVKEHFFTKFEEIKEKDLKNN
jgi:hypothetical protein